MVNHKLIHSLLMFNVVLVFELPEKAERVNILQQLLILAHSIDEPAAFIHYFVLYRFIVDFANVFVRYVQRRNISKGK